jgi:hypothetical protein
MGPRLRHRNPKGAATVERNLPSPRHISTLRWFEGEQVGSQDFMPLSAGVSGVRNPGQFQNLSQGAKFYKA